MIETDELQLTPIRPGTPLQRLPMLVRREELRPIYEHVDLLTKKLDREARFRQESDRMLNVIRTRLSQALERYNEQDGKVLDLVEAVQDSISNARRT